MQDGIEDTTPKALSANKLFKAPTPELTLQECLSEM